MCPFSLLIIFLSFSLHSTFFISYGRHEPLFVKFCSIKFLKIALLILYASDLFLNCQSTGNTGNNTMDTVAFQDMTVKQLREELKNRSLPITGNKATLINRLTEVKPGITTYYLCSDVIWFLTHTLATLPQPTKRKNESNETRNKKAKNVMYVSIDAL